MLVLLGFLLAALLLLIILPAYRRRIERFAGESVRRALPLTETEIRADKDRIRAEYAISVHKLEMKLEESSLTAARQSVEINRRESKIQQLGETIATHKSSVEEHENARRVLEQAILDRLPKVEQRLAEARKLLQERDREIALLTQTGSRQSDALDEATQINRQQSDELFRLKAALETRAARNRETLGDPRFDGEVALRTDIELLRAKTREQAALIDRLQAAKADGDIDAANDMAAHATIDRLSGDLAKAEAQLMAAKSAGESDADAARAALAERVKMLEAAERERAAELAKLKAALKAYEEQEAAAAASVPSPFGRDAMPISAKVEISALQADVEDHRRTIQSLRAEIAGSNERLARQAQHFRDELRRLGSGAQLPGDAPRRQAAEAKRPTLAERIAAPRLPQITPVAALHDAGETDAGRDTGARPGGFLKALNGGADTAVAADEKPPALPAASSAGNISAASASAGNSGAANSGVPEAIARRPRLLERISGGDKT